MDRKRRPFRMSEAERNGAAGSGQDERQRPGSGADGRGQDARSGVQDAFEQDPDADQRVGKTKSPDVAGETMPRKKNDEWLPRWLTKKRQPGVEKRRAKLLKAGHRQPQHGPQPNSRRMAVASQLPHGGYTPKQDVQADGSVS